MATNEWLLIAAILGLSLAAYALGRRMDPSREDDHLAKVQNRHRRRIQGLSVAYVLSMMGVNLGSNLGRFPNEAAALAGIVVSALLGVATVTAYVSWLRQSDDLVRKIETDALALSFGIGIVGIVATGQLANASIGAEASVNRILLVMFLTYGVIRFLGYRRFA